MNSHSSDKTSSRSPRPKTRESASFTDFEKSVKLADPLQVREHPIVAQFEPGWEQVARLSRLAILRPVVSKASQCALALGLPALLLGGCGGWPLYLHLPDPAQPPVEPVAMAIDEAEETDQDSPQSIEVPSEPVDITISGRVESCGYDDSSVGPTWLGHPFDADGDGEPETTRSRSGWYSGDIDLYWLRLESAARVGGTLLWTDAPETGENAPFLPAEPEAAWSSESDLDFWVVVVDEAGSGVILSESGVSRRSPEDLQGGVVFDGSSQVLVGVACHHERAADYQLSLAVRPLPDL